LFASNLIPIVTPDGIIPKCATISKITTSIAAAKIPLLILSEHLWMAAKMVTVPTVHTTDSSLLSANVYFVAQQGDEGQRSSTTDKEKKRNFSRSLFFAFINRPLTSPASHPPPVQCPVRHTF
jgi:hypothetical protein